MERKIIINKSGSIQSQMFNSAKDEFKRAALEADQEHDSLEERQDLSQNRDEWER